ncbi:MAG: MarC family protein [Phaeodactylibacter sp.]|nr:MarC family protein [Phaeodactylibacter sp.]
MLNLKEIFSVSLILFSVIDILGSLPIIIDLKKKGKVIESAKATAIAGVLMIVFLLGGESILRLFGIDVSSFAIAGALIIFLLGLEMILGITLFRDSMDDENSTVVPIAFPLIAGAGTMTTILTLKAEYEMWNIFIGIFVNLIFVYLVLRSSNWISRKLGKGGAEVLRKVFGIILLAIAIKLFKTNLHF